MFLRPAYIREHLLRLLTDSPSGPHTALILLPHGQILSSVSTSSSDWYGDVDADVIEDGSVEEAGLSTLTLRDAGEDEYEEEDEEPYMSTPERNRLLLGLASSQWSASTGEILGSNEQLEDVKVECELGRILLTPFTVLLTPSHPTSLHPEQSHHRSNPLPRPTHARMDYYAPPPQMAEKTEVKEVVEKEEKETLLLALNGGRNVEWQVLERKAKQFLNECQIS